MVKNWKNKNLANVGHPKKTLKRVLKKRDKVFLNFF